MRVLQENHLNTISYKISRKLINDFRENFSNINSYVYPNSITIINYIYPNSVTKYSLIYPNYVTKYSLINPNFVTKVVLELNFVKCSIG